MVTTLGHQLQVKISTQHPNPVLSIAVAPERPRDAQALQLPFDKAAQAAFPRFVQEIRTFLAT